MTDDFEDQLRELIREALPWESPEGITKALRSVADEIDKDPESLSDDEDEDGA
jgi:hypothetical protein